MRRFGRRAGSLLTIAWLLGGLSIGAALAAAPEAPAPRDPLPKVLDQTDVARYRTIRGAQATGDWATADQAMGALNDRRLVGHMMAERYLSPSYRADYRGLLDWLAAYADLPEAGDIRALALRKRPRGAPPPPLPPAIAVSQTFDDDDAAWRDLPGFATDGGGKPPEAALRRVVRAALRNRKTDVAIERLIAADADAAIDVAVVDELRGEVGAALFAGGDDSAALAIAGPGVRSAAAAPNTAWIAGLAAWRSGRKDVALEAFTAAANSSAASPCATSAAAYWAARARLVTGRFEGYDRLLTRAASAPYCFYGLLARRALGSDPRFDWRLPTLDADARRMVTTDPRLSRALALIEIGDLPPAEDELRRAIPTLSPAALPIALTIAERGGLPAIAMGVATQITRAGGPRYDAGLYPLPTWTPPAGFSVNRALIFAIVRVESHFQTRVVSGAGAIGLMQLMPETARAVSPRRTPAQVLRDRASPQGLFDPRVNLALGQRYIDALLSGDPVRDNLLHLAAAYNSGPGALAKWREQSKDGDDPLLFVEGLPIAETRLFVERVMTYLWIYQSRLGQPMTSLDALAEGHWPVYTGRGEDRVEVAERHAGN